MKLLKNLFKYSLNFNILKIKELILFYKRYTLLPRIFGFHQNPSLKYKLSIVYEFLKFKYYSKKNIDYILNCIPRSFFKYYLSHKTGHFEYGKYCIDKQLFYKVLVENSLPIPKCYGVIIQNKIVNFNNDPIELQIEDKKTHVFVKKIKGSVGKGAKIIHKDNLELSNLEGYLIQEICENHSIIKELAPNKAFNTIRVHTYFSEIHNKVIILGAHLKLAAKDEIADNISTGGIGVQININTGELAEFGFSEFTKNKIERYPGSQIKFKDFKIPYWDNLIDLVNIASRKFKTTLIGWDIGITEHGVVFIEGNSGSDIFIPQAFYTPFYTSCLIADFIVEPQYHTWVSKFHKKHENT